MRYSEEELDEMSEPDIRFNQECNCSRPIINRRLKPMQKRYIKYRRTHDYRGKDETLRDKRRFSIKQLFDV